jgi:hypothetical protein
MPHELDAKTLTTLIVNMFDHAFEGENGRIKGGLSKRSYLISSEVLRSGFHNRKVASLLRVLTQTVAARYEEAPTEDDGTSPTADLQQLNALLTARQKKHLEALETSDWMLNTFRRATENGDAWPTDDGSVENQVLYARLPGRKRKSDFHSDQSRQKLRFPSALEMEDRPTTSGNESDDSSDPESS